MLDSILRFRERVVERVLRLQLLKTLEEVDHPVLFQLGFKLWFSTEKALVAFVDEQWRSWHGGGASILWTFTSQRLSVPVSRDPISWFQLLGVGGKI